MVIYLVLSLKSNVVYSVFNWCMVDICQDLDYEVLVYLCNVLIKLMKFMGYGEFYCYVYDELEVFVVGELYLFEVIY